MIRNGKTLTVSIDRSPEEVYAFVSGPENLPKWAPGFCRSVWKVGEVWIAQTAEGAMPFRFAARNPFGIVDHYVRAAGREVFNPMRVIPNGSGSEVMFTLFQGAGMSEEKFQEDEALVRSDLQGLKALLEGSGAP